jgi:hypothetical protein
MEDITEASEEVLWTAGFAVVTAVLLFALLAGVTWARHHAGGLGRHLLGTLGAA